MIDMFSGATQAKKPRTEGPRLPSFKAPLLAALFNERLSALETLPREARVEEITLIAADIAVLIECGWARGPEANQVLEPVQLARMLGTPLRGSEAEVMQAKIDAGRGRALEDVLPLPEEGLYHRDEFRPRFPAECLPDPFQTFAVETADHSGLSVDYIGASLLSASAAAMGRVRTVTTVRGTGFEQPPILWFGLVGRSSQAKSPALGFAKRMLQAVENSLAKANEERRLQWKTDKASAAAVRKRWEKEVEKAAEDNAPAPVMPIEANEPPLFQRELIMIDDATPEAVLQICAGLPRGVILFRDELPGWWNSFNRYNGGGGEREFWLEAHDGGSKRASRVKFDGVPLEAEALAVSIIGGVQPAKLKPFLEGASDGLVERFLWLFPPYQGTEAPTRPVQMGPCIDALLRLRSLRFHDCAGLLSPNVVPLSRSALEALKKFKRNANRWAEIAPEGEDGSVGKADKQVLRLALVLEFMAWAGHGGDEPTEVSVENLNKAIRLWDDYFLPHLRLVLDTNGPKSSAPAISLAKWLIDADVEEFTRTQVCRNSGIKELKDSAAAQRAIDELLGAEWIFPNYSRSGESKGRPKQAYLVNPNVSRRRFRSYLPS